MEIGCKIKKLRCKAGLTQEQLATRLGISPQSVSKWENSVTMPDITLLPVLATELGITIDELFDLTVDQKLQRIENRLDIEEEFPKDVFLEYESFLKTQLEEDGDNARVISLLAHLYHHRMEEDSKRVSNLARRAIILHPEKKDCQWLLQKAEGATSWDWNFSNHTAVIEFYKSVIKNDKITPLSPMPIYEVMDNLLADHRAKETAEYLEIYKTLPAHKPVLVPVYEAAIALAEFDVNKADAIMEEAEKRFGDSAAFLFEKAQYHARKCEYEKAVEYYYKNWNAEEENKPRFTDPLHAIAIIYEILGEYQKAAEAYGKMIICLKEEWGYKEGDAAIAEAEREKNRLLARASGENGLNAINKRFCL